MSNINKITANEQLFTELTPKEGAVVAGGARLIIDRIQAVKAGADTGSRDDTYITFNGEKIWGVKDFSTGDTHTVGVLRDFDSTATIRLFDEDGGIFTGGDDSMGGFEVLSPQPTNGVQKKTISGSGSTYDVFYEVI